MESLIFKQKNIFLDVFCCIFLNVIKNSKCDTLKNSSDVKVDYLDTSNTLYSESKLGLDCSEDDIECMDYMPEYGLYTEDDNEYMDYDFEYAAVTSQKKLFSTREDLKKTTELSFSIWFHHSVHNIF